MIALCEDAYFSRISATSRHRSTRRANSIASKLTPSAAPWIKAKC